MGVHGIVPGFGIGVVIVSFVGQSHDRRLVYLFRLDHLDHHALGVLGRPSRDHGYALVLFVDGLLQQPSRLRPVVQKVKWVAKI
jgi:hypothetical protein